MRLLAQPRITREIVEALRQERRACTNPVAEKFMADLVAWADAARQGGARSFATETVAWCETHKDERLVCMRCENKRRASGPASEKKRAALQKNASKPRPSARKGWPEVLVHLHEDGTATYWSISQRKMMGPRRQVSKADLIKLPAADRNRLARHLDLDIPAPQK